MANYVGGIRLSCIRDSFHRMVEDSLDQIGWLTPNPGTRSDVEIVAEQLDTLKEIVPNKIAISSEDIVDEEFELGSNLTEDSWEIFIDIFAENESIGLALAGDVRDILRGKMSSIGRTDTNFEVYDYQDDSVMFECQIRNVEIIRVRDWDRSYNKFWWVVACQIVDTYYDDQI